MATEAIQENLPLIEQPSRYIGTEINACRKPKSEAAVSIALAFPDLYEIGSSHFGIQILYHIINQQPDMLAERVFAPAGDMERLLNDLGEPLGTLESGTPIGDFDILGMSLLYELTYTNVLAMLELGKIPFLAAERDGRHPLVIAGGPCTCNPEPVAVFFDAILVGDGERALLEMAEQYKMLKQKGKYDKSLLLKRWSRIRGVYVPALFKDAQYSGDGRDDPGEPGVAQTAAGTVRVKREVVPDLDSLPYPDRPVVPYAKPVHDRLRIEVTRGCTRGCRFCQAGMIYRPVREKSPETVLHQVDTSLPETGYDDISLLSLSTGDYTGIVPLMDRLMARCDAERIAVSLPSLRADSISPGLMEQILKVRKTGFTIAPEAGTQRLRDVINKNISREDIFNTATQAFSLGWTVIKLYFMIGLPTETEKDIDGIIELVEALYRSTRKGKPRRAKINVSISTFVPKPHTPFQWEPQISLEESRSKIALLRKALNRPGIQVKWQNPEVSYIEGIWARGDRRLADLLVRAYREGCRFDGWSDHFDFERWKKALEEENLGRGEFYTTRRRSIEEPLPWDRIDNGVSTDFLVAELEKAKGGQATADCRNGDCQQCGVCDFDTLSPVTFEGHPDLPVSSTAAVAEAPSSENQFKFNTYYRKQGVARLLGHIELAKVFSRAARRAGLPLCFSQGFHPMPRISFTDPLPIGMESEKEKVVFVLSRWMAPHKLAGALSRQLPEGLEVIACEPCTKARPAAEGPETATYRISLTEGNFEQQALDAFIAAETVTVSKKGKRGKIRTVELKNRVFIPRFAADRITLDIVSANGSQLRPRHILDAVFHLSERQILTARTVKVFSGKTPPAEQADRVDL